MVEQERHRAELLEFQQKLLDKSQQKPKFSKDLLNLRRIEEHLARQKECDWRPSRPTCSQSRPTRQCF